MVVSRRLGVSGGAVLGCETHPTASASALLTASILGYTHALALTGEFRTEGVHPINRRLGCWKPLHDKFHQQLGSHGFTFLFGRVRTRYPSNHGLFDFHFSSKIIPIVIPI